MSRSFCYGVICLRVKSSGESNREAWFLSAEEGIIKATVFGGPKSRLRSQVSPFHQGRLWIYHDPVKDTRKVTDFDVENWRPGLRELYERTMTADSLAETILATHAGGGAWKKALDFAGKALDCIETANEKTCARILLHFLWVWTELLGVQPDLNHCGACACEAPGDGILWYNLREGSLFCKNCRNTSVDFEYGSAHAPGQDRDYPENRDLVLEPGSRRWLLVIKDLDPHEALRYSPDNTGLRQARFLVLGILTEALGKRLPLWDL